MTRSLVMAKAPVPGTVKTRLRLPPDRAAALQRAFIRDAVEKACTLGPVTLAGTPRDRLDLIASLLPRDVKLIAQAEGDLGEKMFVAARDLFDTAAGPLLILGTDAPTLPPDCLSRAVDALEADYDVSIVPSTDGGYVLLGLRRLQEALFAGIDWSTEAVYEQTLVRAYEGVLHLHRQDPWYDVDTPEDLERLHKELAENPEAAPRTAEVLTTIREQ